MPNKILVSFLVILIIIFALANVAIWGFVVYKYFSTQTSSSKTIQNPVVKQINQALSQSQGVKDCGISKSLNNGTNAPIDKIDFEKDSALVCLGQKIANNCENSKAIAEGTDSSKTIVEISGGSYANCKIKLTAQKYMECPINKLIAFGSSTTEKIPTEEDVLKTPGAFVGTIMTMMAFTFIDPDTASKQIGCTTNFTTADLNTNPNTAPSTTVSTVNSNKYFSCISIKEATYTGELKDKQAFIISWDKSSSKTNYAGNFSNTGWTPYTLTENTNLDKMVIVPLWSPEINNNYQGGIFSVQCDDGKKINIYIPNVINTVGSIGTNGNYFYGKLYVASDGSTYYDEALAYKAAAPK